MNMIDTYDNAKCLSEILLSEMTLNDAKANIAMIGQRWMESEEYRQSLLESISEICDEKQIQQILEKSEALRLEYQYRNSTPEMIQKLEEYHCTQPFVVLNKEDALNDLSEGYPVFIINKEGEYTIANSENDILLALSKNNLLATSQFAIDDIMENLLDMDD